MSSRPGSLALRSFLLLSLLGAAVSGSTASALGTPGLFPTGVNDAGTVINGTTADPHYQITYSNDPAYATASMAAPLSAWAVAINPTSVPNTTSARWISPVQTTGRAAGATPYIYTYSLYFPTPSVSGISSSSSALHVRWACDDDCKIFLNLPSPATGSSTNPLASLTAGWNATHEALIPLGTLSASGLNRLDFCVNNSGGYDTGVFVGELGCTADTQCCVGAGCSNASYYCHNETKLCAPKLANGAAIPSVTGHTPALDGSCTAAAGAAVCTSGVCSTTTNTCGYESGHPCASAATCQSGTCGAGGICLSAGECSVDAECTGGAFCTISTRTCTPKAANGQPVPTDAAHTSPTLDGTCTAAAAALTCASGTCSAVNNRCGQEAGHRCTDGSTCQSGTCGAGGICLSAGECSTDAECTTGHFCTVSTRTCTPKSANGQAIPTDAGHGSPTLDGTCTPAAAALVCTSGVCSTANNACGYEAGHACTTAAACQAGTCGAGGVCLAAGECSADTECAADQTCTVATRTCAAKADPGTGGSTGGGSTGGGGGGGCSAAGAGGSLLMPLALLFGVFGLGRRRRR